MSGQRPPAERMPSDNQSPHSSQSTGQPSFKTNVNRMKTKRWVNAKTYSYDGDDWGDSDDSGDDDDEMDHGQNSAGNSNRPWDRSHQPTSRPFQHPASRMPQNTSSVPAIPAGLVSANQTAAHPGDRTSLTRKPLLPGESTSAAGPDQEEGASDKPLPFIRPADIYKRLEEERKRERSNTIESPVHHEPQAAAPAAQGERSIPGGPAEPDSSSYAVPTGDQMKGSDIDNTKSVHAHPSESPAGDVIEPQKPSDHSPTPVSGSASQIPELKRLSGLGEGFMTSTDKPEATNESSSSVPDTTEGAPGIKHNPSLGFRSVVHQAFDTPDTPATESISRSDSEATAIISPIIQSNTLATDSSSGAPMKQTPTIEEEPSDQGTPEAKKRESKMLSSEIIPGHRRSLTPPSSDNSPAKRPVLRTSDIPGSEKVDISETTPSDWQGVSNTTSTVPDSTNPSGGSVTDSREPPSPSAAGDKAVASSPSISNNAGDINTPTGHDANLQIDTSKSRDSKNISIPNSRLGTPDDYTPSKEEPRSRTQHDSPRIPSEYDSYWDDQDDHKSLKPLPLAPSARQSINSQVVENTSEPPTEATKAPTTVTSESPMADNNELPKSELKKKFSWEMGRAPSTTSAPTQVSATVHETHSKESPVIPSTSDNQGSIQPLVLGGDSKEDSSAKPLQSLQPSPMSPSGSSQLSPTGSESRKNIVNDDSFRPSTGHDHPRPVESSGGISTASQDQKKLLGFREIMAMKTHDQKMAAFNQTRELFATTDTGIDSWTRHMANSHPEHSELVVQNGALPLGSNISHKPSASHNKFPKLSSLGTISLPTGPHSSSGGSQGHTRHASGVPLSGMMNSQQVQAKGKDLLHSAGVLGGKAGGAAKGLFAKGKSRFRHSGSEKVDVLSHPIEPRPSVQGSEDPRPSIDSSTAISTARYENNPSVGSLNLDSQPFSIEGITPTPDSVSNQNDIATSSPKEKKSTVPACGPGADQLPVTIKENDMNSPSDNQLYKPDVINSESNSGPRQPTEHYPATKGDGELPKCDKHDLSMPSITSDQNETDSVDEAQSKFNSGAGRSDPHFDPQETQSVSQTASRGDVKTPHADASQCGLENSGISESKRSSFPPPQDRNATGETIDVANVNTSPAGGNTIVGQSDNSHVTNSSPSQVSNAVNPGSGTHTVTNKLSFEELKPKPPPKDVTTTANQTTPSSFRHTRSMHGSNPIVHYNHKPSNSQSYNAAEPRNLSSDAPAVPNTSSRFGKRVDSLKPPPQRTNTTGTATLSEHASSSHRRQQFQGKRTQTTTLHQTPTAGISASTASQKPTPAPKSRSRSSSAISTMMSKVNIGRHKDEDTKDPSLTSEKRGNLRFRSLRLDNRFQKDKTSSIDRHTSLQASLPKSAAPESRRSEIVGSLRKKQLGMMRGSSLASNINNNKKGNTPKDIPGRPPQEPLQSMYPNQPQEPPVRSSEDSSKPLPATPHDYSPQDFPGNRSSRYYRSLNPALFPVNEDPELNRPAARIPPPSNGYSAGTSQQSGYSAHRPRTSSLVHHHATSVQPTPRPPLADSVNFPQPPQGTSMTTARPTGYSHATNLHMRSRSPLSRSPNPHEDSTDIIDSSDPASNLGRFDSRESSRTEDQARPWNVTLPRDQDDIEVENSRARGDDAAQHPLPDSATMSPVNSTAAHVAPPPPPKTPQGSSQTSKEPWDYNATALQKALNEAESPEQQQRSNVHTVPTMEPIELPANDDSSEEIVMSSTSYPGQEWRPSYAEGFY